MNYWKRPLFALMVMVLAAIACAENPTRIVKEEVRDDSGHSRVVISERPIPTPVIPIYIAPVIPMVPIVPVNSEPLHALKHISEFPGSVEIAKIWEGVGYKGTHFLDSVDKQIHVLQIAGKWCMVVVSKTTKTIITAYASNQTLDQLINMLLGRGFELVR